MSTVLILYDCVQIGFVAVSVWDVVHEQVNVSVFAPRSPGSVEVAMDSSRAKQSLGVGCYNQAFLVGRGSTYDCYCVAHEQGSRVSIFISYMYIPGTCISFTVGCSDGSGDGDNQQELIK